MDVKVSAFPPFSAFLPLERAGGLDEGIPNLIAFEKYSLSSKFRHNVHMY